MGPERGRDPRGLDEQRAASALNPNVSLSRILIGGIIRGGH